MTFAPPLAIQKARNAFKNGVTKNVSFRIQQLDNLYRMCCEHENDFVDALLQDLGKPKFESTLYEIEAILNEIRCMRQNIEKWTKPVYPGKNLATLLDKAFIQYEPYGVVLVLGAWNYPAHISLCPVAGAIAAGNCVIIKPSELAPETAAVIQKLIPKYLDPECYHVITGGPEETSELLKEQFDYVFYTGSARVGQLVREAANKHLTPCTLELGSKSPVYIDDTVDLEVASRRFLTPKFCNAGQMCISPDYLLCTKAVEDKLIPVLKKVLREFYGKDPKSSPDFGRMINSRHFHRIRSLMKNGDIVIGGQHDEATKYIAPTVITNVKMSDPIMQEEIFGPLMPIIVVNDPDEAINIINSKDKPLAMSIYSKNKRVIQNFVRNTSSGSVCVNDSAVNMIVDSLPFGGVGKSGMGAYHGKYSFETFSHKKAVLIRNYCPVEEKVGMFRYPPYSQNALKFLVWLVKKRPSIIPRHMDYIAVFIAGFVVSVLLMKVICSF